MKQRGKKSAAQLSTVAPAGNISRPKPPASLEEAAQDLWKKILLQHTQGHFHPADLELLREFVHTSATLIPRINSAIEKNADPAALRARTSLVREQLQLAAKLRLCVSARTRGDLASVRDAGEVRAKPWEWPQEEA